MSTIQDKYLQALLAKAAYADFINPATGAIYTTPVGIHTKGTEVIPKVPESICF